VKADPRTSGIPVIFMTSLADTHDKVAGFAAGAADYITKPLHVEEMMARVGVHLRLRALQRHLEAQNAQLASANQDLQAFSYSTSHDLRAPLRAIGGFAEILYREHSGGLNEEGRDCLERIIANTNRMTRLIDSLLEYARTGAAAVQAVPVELEPLVRQVAATFSDRIEKTGTRFEAAGPFATPIGDPTLITQIVANLVDNALKYHRLDGQPSIRVSAVREGSHVVIRVADDGIGIEPEFHARIFKVFERLHTPEEYQGSGIGLAIVAKSVRLMGGEVRVESAPGRGSTFSVYLPADEAS
jgi:signal transduction histidine kinase